MGGADQRPLVRALFGLSLTYSARGKIRIGREVAEQMLVVAERLQEPEPLAYAHNLMGNTLFWLAELGTARMHLEKGIVIPRMVFGPVLLVIEGASTDSGEGLSSTGR